MNFFYIQPDSELQATGFYPQTRRVKREGYHVDVYNSERNVLPGEFPDFSPRYGLELHPKSIVTDVLDRCTLPFGFVVSARLKVILENFKLPPHRFYPIDVFGTENTYYWFHTITDISYYIDFNLTEIEVIHKFKFNVESTKRFSSFNEALDFKKSLPRQYTTRFGSIYLTNEFPNFDFFEISGPQYIDLISEKMKRALEEKSVTGIILTKYPKIKILKQATPDTKSVKLNFRDEIPWGQLTSILDALQVASGRTFGVKKLRELIEKLHQDKRISIKKNAFSITITSIEGLQNLVNTYDSNIKISEIMSSEF